MKTQVSQLIRDVMIALREVDPNESGFIGDKDNADLETMIRSKIEQSVDEVHRKASMSELSLDSTIDISYEGTGKSTGFRYKVSTGVLTVLLKAYSEGFQELTLGIDMLRMVCAKSKSWPHSVHNVVYPDDPLFEIVTDRYVGASSDFPAVTHQKKRLIMEDHAPYMDALELRCLSDISDWAHIIVIPKAKIENEMVDIDSKVYHKVVNTIAAKIEVPKIQ